MSIWTKKPISALMHPLRDESRGMHRALGPWDLIAMGIGAIIGAGLFSITGIAAAQYAGPAIIISFLLASIGCAFAGLCYSELASMIPISGSAYTYAYATMGELIAWIIGWDLILEYAVGAATVSISWSAYFVSLLHDFGIALPVELVSSPWHGYILPDGSVVYGWINLPALFIIVFISSLLMLGIRSSSLVNLIIVILKVAIVCLFIGLGAFYIDYENYRPFIPENSGEYGSFGWSGIFRAAGVVFFAYIGFDSISTLAQEARRPQRDMAIGILGSLAICTVLYVLFAWVLVGLVNYQELAVAAPVALAVGKTPFLWFKELVKLAILAGFSSVILVSILGQSRILYAMACDELFPTWFSRLHPYFRTPWHGHIILMVFVGLFGAFAPLEVVGEMTSIGTLFAFVIVCAGVLILRYGEPHLPRPFRTPLFPLIPILGILSCLILMASLGWVNWLRLLLWLALGLVLYSFLRLKGQKRALN